MTVPQVFIKDPDAVLDWHVDWAAWLTGSDNDTISTSTWVKTGDVTIDSDSNTTTTTTVMTRRKSFPARKSARPAGSSAKPSATNCQSFWRPSAPTSSA